MATYNFPQVTLLITHYNRSKSLARLLDTFYHQGFTFGGIVVSDDGSTQEHLNILKTLADKYSFNLVTTPKNKGLGNNINKGQDAVTTPYTLYVQEDFEPITIFGDHFADALAFLEADKELDIARFYAYFMYPYLKPFGKGFSEMVFKKWLVYGNHLKFYVYSDHPHLRRSTFFEKFGRYKEGIKGDRTEFLMAASFIKNNGRGLFYDQFTALFHQKNSADEPSTMNRSSWRESKNPIALAVRYLYLRYKLLKWTFEVKFFDKRSK